MQKESRVGKVELRLRASVVLLAAIASAGCERGASDAIDKARAAIARKDARAAIVELKTAIAKDPKSAQARYLMGLQLLATGDPLAASIELQRARELRHPAAQVLPPLARALLATNQFSKLVEQLGSAELDDPDAAAEVHASVARALLQLGRLDDARQKVAAGLLVAPRNSRALLMAALLDAATGNAAKAGATIDAVLAADPAHAEAWQLKGDLLLRTGADVATALAAHRKSLSLDPANAYAFASVIALHLARQEPALARDQFAAMRKAVPRHPQTLFFDAYLNFEAGEYARARPIFQTLLKATPDNLVVLQWAGANELGLHSPVTAEAMLAKVVKLSREAPLAHRLLAQAYLRLGQPDKAIDILGPLLQRSPPAADVLALAGHARLMAGDAAGADKLFAQAVKIKPDDPQVRLAVAMAEFTRGNDAAAFGMLSRIAHDDKSVQADLALISARLQRGNQKEALDAVDALDRKQPDQPLAPLLRGRILLAQKDARGARSNFELALARNPRYYPAVAELATLDFQSDKVDAARKRLTDFVRLVPDDAHPLLALARIAERSGAGRDEVARLLESATKADATNATAWLRLLDHHMGTQNVKAAAAVAQSGLASLPDNVDLLDRLGRAQLRLGDARQAAATYGRLARAYPNAAAGHAGLAEAYAAAGDLEGADKHAERAMKSAPGELRPQEVAINVALKQGQPQRALAIARQLQAQRPDQAIGFTLEGEIEGLQGNWNVAAVAFRKAIAKKGPAAAPASLHQVLLKSGKDADAEAFAERWVKDHPDDAMFLFYLADSAQSASDLLTAERRYREVLAIQPSQAQALNNLAMLLLAQRKPDALAFAEQAAKAAPDHPAILDTLAQAQLAEKQSRSALTTQKAAIALSPDDPSLRLTLARILVQNGDKPQAAAELRRLTDLGKGFARQSEVQSLLREIGR